MRTGLESPISQAAVHLIETSDVWPPIDVEDFKHRMTAHASPPASYVSAVYCVPNHTSF
jgi:hypothetical protein